MTQASVSSRRGLLVPALLDFERMPGRYPLALHEPRQLFDEAQAVLQLAAGRPVEGLAELTGSEEADARRAARFFVRTAFLRDGNDHYALLGLPHAADADQIRDHYRLMIRMTHPDFQASGEHWPSDAASRINIANDVLSSPERRADYDATLQASAKPVKPATAGAGSLAAQPATAALRKTPPLRRKGLPKAALPRRWGHGMSTRTKIVLATVGALFSGGALMLLNSSDSGSLTARQRTVSDDTAAYLEAGARLPVAAQPPAEAAPVAATPDEPPRAVSAAGNTPQKGVTPLPHRTAPGSSAAATAAATAATPAKTVAITAPPAQGTAAPREATAAVAARDTPAAAAAPETEAAESARLTMAQVHPALTNVVGSLYSGRGENLAQWIDRDWRTLPANNAFVTQLNQWLGGQRVTQLGKVSFKSKNMGDQLVVDGVVEIHLQDGANAVQVRDLQLRAYFQPQDGRPVLTQLVASQAR